MCIFFRKRGNNMRKEEPIRIAHIIGKWVGGGVEAFVLNYYRHMNHDRIQFDFICDEDSTCIPYEEIERLGGRVILVPPYQKVFKYHKELKRIFKENNYKIVHSHINTLSVFSLFAAKCAGVKVRIAHSHSSTNPKEFKRTILKLILRNFSRIYATDYFACSEDAAIFQFGKRTFNSGKVKIINNAIDVGLFKYDDRIRSQIRNKYNFGKDTVVLGNVGRMVTVKNQKFIIDIFNCYHRLNPDSKLLLVGDGPLKKQLQQYVSFLSLDDYVIFAGQKSDIYKYYMAMDVFLFPSLYEGFGLSLIEAQCSGLFCLASSNVPKSTKISNLVLYIYINNKPDLWARKILINDNRYNFNIIDNFDISKQSVVLNNIYLNMLGRPYEKN